MPRFQRVYPFIAFDPVLLDSTLRPCLEIQLRGPGGVSAPRLARALVDSGADRSVFPSELAADLGIDLAACRVESFSTAGGIASEYIWPEPVIALFDGQEVALTAAFAPTPITLLGREDFFAGYRITIDQRDQTLELAGHRAA